MDRKARRRLLASFLFTASLLVGAVSAWSSKDSSRMYTLCRLKPVDHSGSHVPSLVDPRTRYQERVILPDKGFPGLHRNWDPPIDSGEESYISSGRFKGRKTLITGGDSGVGRAVAIAHAREGADVTISYLPEEQPDADKVKALVEAEGVRFFAMSGNLRNETFCTCLVHQAHEAMGGLDILVSNAGYWTFEDNVFASFYLVRAPAPLLPPGFSIIFTPRARRGGLTAALVSMAQALVLQLGPQGIRVNAVAPGPTATNFLTSHGLTTENADTIVSQLPLGRIAQPAEIAPAYVMLVEGSGSQSIASAYGINGGSLSF
ncbi:hypothetical protein C8A01DRAFT_48436 [Parachaetomium inaequale]|uniref:Uncharacterized protein n=1 Tax=Parachaetomium inaequale TaxID=2588326 RepID=A0AAN6SQ17_9PEZI|nr:hypothetical protein C8A01DRAFT_48436 [Parachaetomium inaequale]